MKNLFKRIFNSREDFLIGAGAGNVVGGLVGVAVLPLGWFTILFGVVALVGAYIS